jgi:hypothetical protein
MLCVYGPACVRVGVFFVILSLLMTLSSVTSTFLITLSQPLSCYFLFSCYSLPSLVLSPTLLLIPLDLLIIIISLLINLFNLSLLITLSQTFSSHYCFPLFALVYLFSLPEQNSETAKIGSVYTLLSTLFDLKMCIVCIYTVLL